MLNLISLYYTSDGPPVFFFFTLWVLLWFAGLLLTLHLKKKKTSDLQILYLDIRYDEKDSIALAATKTIGIFLVLLFWSALASIAVTLLFPFTVILCILWIVTAIVISFWRKNNVRTDS